SLKDDNYFRSCTSKIIETREDTKQKLAKLGFIFPDSKSNFIFASHPDYDAGMIFEKLKARKIFVRYWNKPRINQYMRITIGTPEEMNCLLTALQEIIGEWRIK
ncbi:MAG: aminotransferase class I/II-fold pyridoxal phosphate-dependent enzyme, partial [Oscillospiraceae bacterium]|nr:aminotransferase class I/II-fold pyridoxal phosphate-dependent enzyme [Oscillospiraceae bacterium]